MSSSLIIRTCHQIFPAACAAVEPPFADAPAAAITLTPAPASTTWLGHDAVPFILRWRVPDSRRDLARNRAEVSRVLGTGRIDFDTARMIYWAIDLTAAALPAEPASRLRRAHNPNVSYHVPINPLFARSCIANPSQVPENTWGEGRGWHTTSEYPPTSGNPKKTKAAGPTTLPSRAAVRLWQSARDLAPRRCLRRRSSRAESSRQVSFPSREHASRRVH